ncbi:MAG: hypothetical protein M0T71_11830 [Actinomycetota bacterium]|nr:hypothetical protein [Actinomycetota bacterium]
MDLRRRLERQAALVVGLLDGKVLGEDGLLEGHRHGRSGRVAVEVVAPQRALDPAMVGGLGLEEEPDHVGAAGIEEVGAQHQVERGAHPTGDPPALAQRAGPRRHAGVLAVEELVLAARHERPSVAADLERRHHRRSGAEGGRTDERQVGEVEEIVRQQPGSGASGDDRGLAGRLRRPSTATRTAGLPVARDGGGGRHRRAARPGAAAGHFLAAS